MYSVCHPDYKQIIDMYRVCHLDYNRDQREWVFEVREVKSEKEKLSLFF